MRYWNHSNLGEITEDENMADEVEDATAETAPETVAETVNETTDEAVSTEEAPAGESATE
jgi:hypothetical protein